MNDVQTTESPSFICKLVVSYKAEDDGAGGFQAGDEVTCEKKAVLHDEDCSMCFTCAREAARGGHLSKAGQREFDAIEAKVMRLKS